MTALDFDLLGAHMPDDTKTPHPHDAGEMASRVVQTWIAPLVTGITLAGCLGVGAAALGMWRSEPVTSAEVAQLKSDLAAVRLDLAAASAKIAALETTDRQRGVEIQQLAKTLDKIEAYQGTTMKHVQEINVQLAEIRGERRKLK